MKSESLCNPADNGSVKIGEAGQPKWNVNNRGIGQWNPVARELIFRFAPAPAVPTQIPLKNQACKQSSHSRRPHQAQYEKPAMRAQRSISNNQTVENRAEREGQDQIDENGQLDAVRFCACHRLNASSHSNRHDETKLHSRLAAGGTISESASYTRKKNGSAAPSLRF